MQQLITTPTQLGEILRSRRRARQIPQQELADKLGISQSRLSTLEGEPSSLTLDRLLALTNLLGLELVLKERSQVGSQEREW